MIRPTLRDGLWFAALTLIAICWMCDHANLVGQHERQLQRAQTDWAAASAKDLEAVRQQLGEIVAKVEKRFDSPKDDAKVIEVLAEENASLKEENAVQQKLIDTLKAERQAIRNANDPT